MRRMAGFMLLAVAAAAMFSSAVVLATLLGEHDSETEVILLNAGVLAAGGLAAGCVGVLLVRR